MRPRQPQISFSAYTPETPDLEDVFRLDPVTGQVAPITHQPAPETASHRGGDWSPDRTRVVAFGGPGSPTRVYVLTAASGAVEAEVWSGGEAPTWLDDHTLLLVRQDAVHLPGDEYRALREVLAVDMATWTVRQVTQVGDQLTVHGARWHPQAGLALTVTPVSAQQPTQGVRVATVPAARVQRAVAGTGPRVLPGDLRYPFGATATSFPDWSPDGTRLAVVRHHGAAGVWSPTDIAVGTVRTGRLRVLVDGSGLTDDGDPALPSGYGVPAWSPDGAAVAYLEYHRDQWGEIWVADAVTGVAGGGRRQVTDFGHGEVVVGLDW